MLVRPKTYWLYITVDQPCTVHALNGINDLKQYVDGHIVSEVFAHLLLVLSETAALEVHDYEILLLCLLQILELVYLHYMR